MITLEQLQKAMPHAGANAVIYLSSLNYAMSEFDISNDNRIKMFLAQIAHESCDLAFVEENLNYSAAALVKTWPPRFPTLDAALPYNRQPMKIANHVYANRMGNGDEASGMGWLHRGAGLIQLTGYDNQKLCAEHFGIPIEKIGDWLRTPEGACRSAAWFWKTHGCNEYADKGDFDGVSDMINIGRKTEKQGDAIGYSSRLASLINTERAIG